jgi:hypothetical protein
MRSHATMRTCTRQSSMWGRRYTQAVGVADVEGAEVAKRAAMMVRVEVELVAVEMVAMDVGAVKLAAVDVEVMAEG